MNIEQELKQLKKTIESLNNWQKQEINHENIKKHSKIMINEFLKYVKMINITLYNDIKTSKKLKINKIQICHDIGLYIKDEFNQIEKNKNIIEIMKKVEKRAPFLIKKLYKAKSKFIYKIFIN